MQKLIMLFVALFLFACNRVDRNIIEVCCEIGADIPLMLAIADAESTLEQHPNTYEDDGTVGIYQISKNYVKDYNENENFQVM